jgi:hypothetical protein
MAKLRIAALDVPEFVTEASEPGGNVLVLPTATVAACPGGPTVKIGSSVTLRSLLPEAMHTFRVSGLQPEFGIETTMV